MAEVLVVGKKISEMDLVTDIVGDEKIPTGVVGDKAVTTGQLLTYLDNNGKVQWGRIEGDIANQTDLQNQFAQQLATLQNHIQDQGNPHNVTKEQLGLGLVDNTADMDKPVSTAVQEALANKTHNSLLDRDADGAHPAGAILDESGVTQQQVNDLTGAPYRVKAGGYNIDERVVLEDGDIARSVVDGNTVNPNVDMTGWRKEILPQNVKTISELKELPLSEKAVNVSGSLYEWQPENSTTVDDVYFVQSNHSTTGRWVNVVNTLQSVSKPDTINLFRHRRKVELSQLHNISDTVVLGHDYLKVEGFGENSGFVWQGGDAPVQSDLALLKPIVALKKADIANAVSGAKLEDFLINANNAQNVCALDARYITNNSKVEGIRVSNIGINSVGYYVSKQWYARYTDCYALGLVSNNREGIGVYVDTRSPEGTINQVNSITLDISCRELKYGYLIDPSRYIYTLIIPAGVTIEKCAVGIKVLSSTLPVTIRNGVISAYFERNDVDVEWGDISDTRSLDQKITWLNCSFADTGSKVILNQGQHTFIGCTGLETLVVNNNATVKLDNTYVDIIENNTGSPRNVLNLIRSNSVAGSSRYSLRETRPLKSISVGISLGSGEGTNPVTIDLMSASEGIFSSTNIPYQGRKARIFAIAQRNYDTTTAFTWQGTVLQKSTGWYLIPDPTSVTGTATDPTTSEVVGNVTATRAWTITASIDNNGVLTLSSAGGDTKYYDVTVTAM